MGFMVRLAWILFQHLPLPVPTRASCQSELHFLTYEMGIQSTWPCDHQGSWCKAVVLHLGTHRSACRACENIKRWVPLPEALSHWGWGEAWQLALLTCCCSPDHPSRANAQSLGKGAGDPTLEPEKPGYQILKPLAMILDRFITSLNTSFPVKFLAEGTTTTNS